MSRTDDNRGGQWCAAQRWLASQIPIEQVPVASLRRGDSPRIDSDSKGSAEELHEAAGERPIIVRRSTMEIIDGDRRVGAALRRHQDTIAVQYFDGSSDECFVLAVLANTITHGLPLSLEERRAAAFRILGNYPAWSDRMIGSLTRLSHHTVSKVRRGLSTGQFAQLKHRLGMDGKTRPAPRRDQGRTASKPVPADRSASAQGSGRHADNSADIVGGVRARLERRVEPLAPNAFGAVPDSRAARGYVALKRLLADPALHTDKGRALMDLLCRSLRLFGMAPALAVAAPAHSLNIVADAAAAIGDSWTHLAHDLHRESHVRMNETEHGSVASTKVVYELDPILVTGVS